MYQITFNIAKANVFEEVAKTTSYIGAKMRDDETAYDRIFTTDADSTMLDRFWTECADLLTDQLKPFLLSGGSSSTSYNVVLSLSSSYDQSLTSSITTSMRSYFVAGIIERWCKFTDKEEAVSYAADATRHLDDIMRKIYYKKKPTRTLINGQ